LHGGAVDTLAVPSDEHTPLSEMVVNLKYLSVDIKAKKNHDFTSNNL
jgi:hypothetical protein